MATWKRDVRTGVLALLLLVMWALPWFWYGAACVEEHEPERVAAAVRVEGPCVALTFDDGPRSDTTPVLLDGLAQRGVHATFFVIGDRIPGREDILKRMAAEGHQIGVHSQNHKALSDLNTAGLEEEVTRLEETLTQLLGQREFMIRPPYGFTSPCLRRWAKEPIILWSVDTMDWSDHDTDRQVRVVVDKAQDGDIILMHDIYHASVDTALRAVDELMARGYRFVTVEELFALRGVEPQGGKEYRCLPAG
ncbi:MAG: polysaccharide deacetylase family protein [Oscillospiraceae bacterium]|nr:polysaccharide deacetylase family protein [Oscillospiraceae bacterium]